MIFGFKDKEDGRATTTILSSNSATSASSHNSLRNSFEKVVKAGKNICRSFSATLSRKIPGKSPSTNKPESPICLSISATSSSREPDVSKVDPLLRSSSNSTAPTEPSLPHLDCGENFFVPGISPSPESHQDVEQRPCQEQDDLSIHSMASTACEATDTSVDQAEQGISTRPEQLSVKKGKTDRLRPHLKAIYKKIVLPKFMLLRLSKSKKKDTGRNDAADALPDVDTDEQDVSSNLNPDDPDEGGSPRCDFKTIEAIPDTKYQDLFKACNLSPSPTDSVDVVRREKGTYHAATFVTVSQGSQTLKYVVRVPGHGTPARWTEEDGYVLKNEAQLIEYIRKNTLAPVAQVIDYSTGHDNALGFPYILMTMLPGTPAHNIWFPRDYPSVDTDLAFRNADVPPPHIEKKRVTFLRSLARAMTQIQTLTFDAIGAPNFDDDGVLTNIGPTAHWIEKNGDQAFKRPPCATTEAYFQGRMKAKVKQLNKGLVQNPDQDDHPATNFKYIGVRTILHFILTQPAFHGPPDETFTLHHHDLDLQNILVDDEGNVTGIIDWDNAMAAPRCFGATAVPMFLRSDWFPDYTFGLQIPPCMAWNYEHYRRIYAAAMIEASDVENAEFTLKSGLYQAVVAIFTTGGDEDDLVPKLLREIPHFRADYEEFVTALGRGAWFSARSLLQTHFEKIFKPELPSEGLLAALDDELEMQIWWSCCDELLEFYEAENPEVGVEEEDEVGQPQHGSAAGSG